MSLVANGVLARHAALDAPEHAGRAERHGRIAKDVMKKIISEHQVSVKEQMRNSAVVSIETTNDVIRRDGFAPSQWVLGKLPRRPRGLDEEAE